MVGWFHLKFTLILAPAGRSAGSQRNEIAHKFQIMKVKVCAMSAIRYFWSYEHSRTLGTLSAKASYYGRKYSECAVNALFGVLAELVDTRLRIVTCDASRKNRTL